MPSEQVGWDISIPLPNGLAKIYPHPSQRVGRDISYAFRTGQLGIYHPRDPTYGRYLMDISPDETKLEADPEIRTTSRRVFLEKNGKGEVIHLKQEELDSAKGKPWIYYKIWEKGSGNNCDVVMLHGKSPSTGFAVKVGKKKRYRPEPLCWLDSLQIMSFYLIMLQESGLLTSLASWTRGSE